MKFATHSELEGSHSFLSASNYSWIRYDEEHLDEVFFNRMEAIRGTRYHEYAKEAILLRRRQADTEVTLDRYINDAIGFRMTPEVLLFYSINAYGTADAIRFDENTMTLRIHDLKNGVTKASMDQLKIYCAYFCLEYKYKPADLYFILRIYQNDAINELTSADPDLLDDIVHIIDKLISFDRRLEALKEAML